MDCLIIFPCLWGLMLHLYSGASWMAHLSTQILEVDDCQSLKWVNSAWASLKSLPPSQVLPHHLSCWIITAITWWPRLTMSETRGRAEICILKGFLGSFNNQPDLGTDWSLGAYYRSLLTGFTDSRLPIGSIFPLLLPELLLIQIWTCHFPSQNSSVVLDLHLSLYYKIWTLAWQTRLFMIGINLPIHTPFLPLPPIHLVH